MKALCFALVLTILLASEVSGASVQVKAAFHVHTTFSTGVLSLEEVIEEARREGIGAVIVTDNLLLRFEYGLFPLRGLVRKVVEKPSAHRMGIARYLGAIEEAQARFPDVILIPGVEVIPYYYWTGSVFTGDLTLWDSQKNLLVVGLSRAEDYERIPAIGNGQAFQLGWPGLFQLALAVVAIGGGIQLLRTKRERAIQMKHFILGVPKRYRLLGWSALGVGVLLLLDGFASSESNPYRGNLGIGPYQQVVEYAESRDGAVFWSFPEARDARGIDLGRLGKVSIRTEPYPEALLQTRGYTGFGAVYPDNVTFTEPGRQWDQLLLEYSEGRRGRPAWGIGEVGYHGPSKWLGEALTTFLAPERSRKAILEALREGRMYALSPLRDHHLVLEDFSISLEGVNHWVPMGGELEASGPRPLRISLKISASNGREMPFTLRLIRSGKVLNILQGKTPFEQLLTVEPPEAGGREFFRIAITKPHRLLSNPIFVRRRG